MFNSNFSQRPCAILSSLVLLLLGCSQKNEPARTPTFPVMGKFMYEGKPAAGVMLKLLPEATKGRTPTATVREDGSFSMSYYGQDDGAPAGKYRLLVLWMRPPAEGGLPQDYFRGRYADPQNAVKTIEVLEAPNDLGTIALP
jgi:hypothetical protein